MEVVDDVSERYAPTVLCVVDDKLSLSLACNPCFPNLAHIFFQLFRLTKKESTLLIINLPCSTHPNLFPSPEAKANLQPDHHRCAGRMISHPSCPTNSMCSLKSRRCQRQLLRARPEGLKAVSDIPHATLFRNPQAASLRPEQSPTQIRWPYLHVHLSKHILTPKNDSQDTVPPIPVG